jgi:hypothetical protein
MYSSDFHERFGSLKECTKFLNFDPECLRDKAGERSELKPLYFNMFNRDSKPDENQLQENSEPRHEARLLITEKKLRYDARAMTVQARDMPLGELADNGRRESDSFGEIIEIDSDAKKNQYYSKKRVKINPAHKNSSEPAKKPIHFKSK